jgi:hypothetical protein
MSPAISPTPNEVLRALLDAHGYETNLSGERVVVAGHGAQVSSEIFVHSPNDPVQLQLDVRVHLLDGRTLGESFVGIGETVCLAMGDGFDQFSRASFHVLLQAFFALPDDLISPVAPDEDCAEVWQLPSGRFRVWIGDATFRGEAPVAGEELVRWFEPFAEGICQAPMRHDQAHWVRLYYAQHNGKMMKCEVLFDNKPWYEMQRKMAASSWPQGEKFYSARLFLVLQPHKV